MLSCQMSFRRKRPCWLGCYNTRKRHSILESRSKPTARRNPQRVSFEAADSDARRFSLCGVAASIGRSTSSALNRMEPFSRRGRSVTSRHVFSCRYRPREGRLPSLSHPCPCHDKGIQSALVDERIHIGARVTLEVGPQPDIIQGPVGEVYSAKVTSFDRYRSKRSSIQICSSMRDHVRKGGEYWGFTVRIAQGLSSVFLECPFSGGYDLVIGTSERGNYVRHLSDLHLFSHQ